MGQLRRSRGLAHLGHEAAVEALDVAEVVGLAPPSPVEPVAEVSDEVLVRVERHRPVLELLGEVPLEELSKLWRERGRRSPANAENASADVIASKPSP